jgi:uncharacterized protein
MAANYVQTLFTENIRALQAEDGSRESYGRMEAAGDGGVDRLGVREQQFIAARDSFYLASVTSEGWPYVQHRGGPAGFLKVLGDSQLGFADYRGNRQHVSSANIIAEPRVSLLLMDYPRRKRLKLLGLARTIAQDEDPELLETLMPDGYRAVPQRAYLIEIVGFDWNCPQHITPRFTEAELAARLAEIEVEKPTPQDDK